MMSNEEIIKSIYDLMIRDDIDGCYLFGSFLTNRFLPESDIDIAIIGDIKLEDMLYLEGNLEEQLNRSIDLVKIEDLPRYIQLNIISRNKRIIFKETDKVKEFLDELEKWYKDEYPFWLKMQRELGYKV